MGYMCLTLTPCMELPMSSKYTKSARMRECQVRIPGYCNFNPETTIPAHINGGGMGMKHDDRHLAFCCGSCHDILDGRRQIKEFTYDELKLMHLEGVIRTQIIWINEGIM